MSTSRASASPLTHTKHSVLEKVRGHIVRIRRVLVLMLWKCTTTRAHTQMHQTQQHTHTKPLSMQVHGSNVSLTVRTRKKEKDYWDLSFFCCVSRCWDHDSSEVCPDPWWFGVHCKRTRRKKNRAQQMRLQCWEKKSWGVVTLLCGYHCFLCWGRSVGKAWIHRVGVSLLQGGTGTLIQSHPLE